MAARAGLLPLVLVVAIGLEAQAPDRVAAHYDLRTPTHRTELPRELLEISALTSVDDRVVACLQDEVGTIFFVEHASGRIISRIPFAGPGDYEGLARVGGDLYTLRSDGLLHHVGLRQEQLVLLDSARLDVADRDLEALCYDRAHERLLIVPKSGPRGSSTLRDHRLIHGWDLRTRRQLPDAVLDLRITDLTRQAEALGIQLPTLRKHNGRSEPTFKFRASAIAVHPLDDTFWILCAVDHALVVVDRTGRLIDLVGLDAKVFPQAEGLTFLPNGDLLISNEGNGGPADLLYFARRP